MKNNKVFNNAKWIIICRVVQSLIQMVIGMISARYLGPANYGLIGYAGSVVGFALPVMQLGLNSTLVHELVETPDQEGKIMGTALMMDIVSSLACMLLVAGFVSVANRGETQTIIVCILYSTMLLFRALELLQCWFQYKLESKYSSIAALCAYVVVSVYKIYVLAAEKNIYWFAVVNSIDFGIVGIALLVIYKKHNGQRLSFSWKMVRRLFFKGKYYILASMMVTVFLNTDHIMLKMMVGDAENGFYTAAVTCTCICQFLYSAVLDSMRPVIFEYKKNQSPEYEKYVVKMYNIIIYIALFQGIGSAIFSREIMYILYGRDYAAAVPVLQVLVWQVVFGYIGNVRDIWLQAEGRPNIIWKINLLGCGINISMNTVLIPAMGAFGAALASLLTQILINFCLGFVVPALKRNNKLMLSSLNPKIILEMVKH